MIANIKKQLPALRWRELIAFSSGRPSDTLQNTEGEKSYGRKALPRLQDSGKARKQ